MENLAPQLSEKIRHKGFRMTNQRREIIRLLDGNKHMTPTEICQRLAEEGQTFTEPTVYRTLEFLQGQGLVLVTHGLGRQLQYELTLEKHHHFYCSKCQQQQEVPTTVMEEVFGSVKHQTGFEIREDHLTLHGLCPMCQNL